jgi:hypothetical protein
LFSFDITVPKVIIVKYYSLVKSFFFSGRDCEITTCENTKVQGAFQGLDSDLSTICIENLVTPMGTIPTTFLRSTDIIRMCFPLHKEDLIVK